jgi:hypothetical protein
MNTWKVVALSVGGLIASGIAVAHWSRRSAMDHAEKAYSELATTAGAPQKRFDPEQVAHLPEIARRYFRHAVAPGTPLFSSAELEMEGTFLLGDKGDYQRYRLTARQVLRPLDQFVWIPEMRSGPIVISGSDGLVDGKAWTRFWLLGLVPVAQVHTSPDVVRSAQFRAVVEGALWLPTSLLPENDVQWEQAGADEARVTFRQFSPPITLTIKLNAEGAVQEVVGQRWSNANAEQAFRLQPFGGTVRADRTFEGLTIPSRVAVGNHFGTAEYLPFFQAEVTRARYR